MKLNLWWCIGKGQRVVLYETFSYRRATGVKRHEIDDDDDDDDDIEYFVELTTKYDGQPLVAYI